MNCYVTVMLLLCLWIEILHVRDILHVCMAEFLMYFQIILQLLMKTAA